VGTCLPSRYPADSTNKTFQHDITLNLEVVGCGISYVVRVVSVTEHVIKGSKKVVLPTIFLFFQNKYAKNRTDFLFYGIKLIRADFYRFPLQNFKMAINY
jgi:hypothetical protein